MTDRDLIEAAAKASGISLMWSSKAGINPRRVENGNTWLPLEDDGDALRLAVKLGFIVATYDRGPYVSDAFGKLLAGGPECMDGELTACVRRQIVRAAAVMATR